jgi:hypothetical protein
MARRLAHGGNIAGRKHLGHAIDDEAQRGCAATIRQTPARGSESVAGWVFRKAGIRTLAPAILANPLDFH